MKTEPRIPRRLFLDAGKAVERALRKATFEALLEHDVRHHIATWEDGKVVLIPGRKVPATILRHFDTSSISGAPKESLISQRDEMFLDMVFGSASQIYIKDEQLYIEFLHQNREVGDFLASLENANVLQSICRNITGRAMTAQVIIVEDQTPDRELSVDSRWWVEGMQHLIDTISMTFDWPLARRVMALRDKLNTRQADKSPDSLQMSQTLPTEGDDLTSQR